MGLNAEEIVERIGHFTLAQVYAALTYYHANPQEIEAYLATEKADYERLATQMGTISMSLMRLFIDEQIIAPPYLAIKSAEEMANQLVFLSAYVANG
jgi:hypothetical protein